MALVHRAPASRSTWYWNGGSIHFFRYGFHLKHRRGTLWRHVRLAFFSRRSERTQLRLIDYSYRRTTGGTAKRGLVEPCWRFVLGLQCGRMNWTRSYADSGDSLVTRKPRA
jgi:hypothetical protein